MLKSVDGQYVEEGWVDKTCKVCKKDTGGEPRQVDKFGRYVHVACLEKANSGNFFTRLFSRWRGCCCRMKIFLCIAIGIDFVQEICKSQLLQSSTTFLAFRLLGKKFVIIFSQNIAFNASMLSNPNVNYEELQLQVVTSS